MIKRLEFRIPGSFQNNHYYRSENPKTEVWNRIERLSSYEYIINNFSPSSGDKWEDTIKYANLRILQSLEFYESQSNSSILTSPLNQYYSFLNLMRALIALKFENFPTKGHGLKLLPNSDILECKAQINNGTFSKYLDYKKININKEIPISLKTVLQNINELSSDTINDPSIETNIFNADIALFDSGRIEIQFLYEYNNIDENWTEYFPTLKDKFKLKEHRVLTSDCNSDFKNHNNFVSFLYETFETSLHRLNPYDFNIWYLRNQKQENILNRLSYYYIGSFILSSLVRYEPEIILFVSDRSNQLSWILKKFISYANRFFPQLFIIELQDDKAVYF